ncbi:MAG TPA: hypothetical protein VGS22_28825 [Thermoanaerobaculia bacterium]|nr:hypothetical protein [Thermoanaerobaculia bacterium]
MPQLLQLGSIEAQAWQEVPPIPTPYPSGQAVHFPLAHAVHRGSIELQAWQLAPPFATPYPEAQEVQALPLQAVHWGSIVLQLMQAPFWSLKLPGQPVHFPFEQTVQLAVTVEHC